jgi:hypothetical protein
MYSFLLYKYDCICIFISLIDRIKMHFCRVCVLRGRFEGLILLGEKKVLLTSYLANKYLCAKH